MNRKEKKRRKGRIITFLITFAFLLPPAAPLPCQCEEASCRLGEELEFELRWEFMPAGTACLRVHPDTRVNGVAASHFVMKARTNSFLDTFYKVDNRIDAFATPDLGRSVLYKNRQREGRRKRDITVTFDWENKMARYRNRDRAKPPVPLLPGSLDPLSAFYYVRRQRFREGDILSCPVTDGKKNVIGRVRVIRRETVTVKAGTFDTLLLLPDMRHAGGVFRKSPGARLYIWVTADARHMPVLLKSQVAVGSFLAELARFTPGKPDADPPLPTAEIRPAG